MSRVSPELAAQQHNNTTRTNLTSPPRSSQPSVVVSASLAAAAVCRAAVAGLDFCSMLHFSAVKVGYFFSTAQLSMQGGLLLRALRSTPRLSPDDSSGDDQASTTLEVEGGGPSFASGPSAAPPRSLQAPPPSLLNALRALPGNNRVQKSLNLFTGPEYRNRRHMVYLAQCKKLK